MTIYVFFSFYIFDGRFGDTMQEVSGLCTNICVYVHVCLYYVWVFSMYKICMYLQKSLYLSYPYPTKWGRYNMFSSCCDNSAIVFTTRHLPDVNPP
jgi:hypothetical protein